MKNHFDRPEKTATLRTRIGQLFKKHTNGFNVLLFIAQRSKNISPMKERTQKKSGSIVGNLAT